MMDYLTGFPHLWEAEIAQFLVTLQDFPRLKWSLSRLLGREKCACLHLYICALWPHVATWSHECSVKFSVFQNPEISRLFPLFSVKIMHAAFNRIQSITFRYSQHWEYGTCTLKIIIWVVNSDDPSSIGGQTHHWLKHTNRPWKLHSPSFRQLHFPWALFFSHAVMYLVLLNFVPLTWLIM